MVEQQMWDPIGQHVVELRNDDAVGAIVGENPHVSRVVDRRVRPKEPAPGDKQGGGSYKAFIVVGTLVLRRHPQVPIQRDRHVVRCYGRDWIEAEALYNAASAVFHGRGPRQTGTGKGIYVSHDDTGGSDSPDPDTQQPCYVFVVESLATTQAVAL